MTYLPDKCPFCGEVARNDMALVRDTQQNRIAGHVQFACNYEVEIQIREVDGAPEISDPVVIRECRKGKIWPTKQ